jgi:hypothetical protein
MLPAPARARELPMTIIQHDHPRPHVRVRTVNIDAIRAAVGAMEGLCREIRTSRDMRVLIDGMRLLCRRAAEISELLRP